MVLSFQTPTEWKVCPNVCEYPMLPTEEKKPPETAAVFGGH
jgi:hypothetical protein